jgi:hypothetical protein
MECTTTFVVYVSSISGRCKILAVKAGTFIQLACLYVDLACL